MRLNAADFYLNGSLEIWPFVYTGVKETWKSPVLLSGSMMLPLRPSPQLLRVGGQGHHQLYFQHKSPASSTPKTALQLKLHTVADGGVERNTMGLLPKEYMSRSPQQPKPCQLTVPGCAKEASQQAAMQAMWVGY